MSFHKKVSGGEKLMIAYNQLRPPFVIQLTVEGEGDPDPESLHDAIERAAEVNPGCRLRFGEVEGEESWVLGPSPTLTVVDAPGFSAASDEDAPFFRWPMDTHEGPTCELVLVRTGAESGCYLVFRALHAVMDGQGTILWAKDVMRCLRGEAPIGHPSAVVIDDLVRDLKKKPRPLPGPDALHPFGPAKNDAPGNFHWRRVTVDAPLDSGATGRLSVALANKARKRNEGIVRINLPTDLRHYVAEERTTGNMFNSLFIEVPEGAAPEMVGLQVVQMLYKHHGGARIGVYGSHDVGSLAVHKVKVFRDLACMHDTDRYVFSATLSHLGVLGAADFSGPGFEAKSALFVPLVGDSGCVVHINGFKRGQTQHTEVTVGLADVFTGEAQLDELAELVRSCFG